MHRLLPILLVLASSAAAAADPTWTRITYRTDPALLGPGADWARIYGIAVTDDGRVTFANSQATDAAPFPSYLADVWTWTTEGGAIAVLDGAPAHDPAYRFPISVQAGIDGTIFFAASSEHDLAPGNPVGLWLCDAGGACELLSETGEVRDGFPFEVAGPVAGAIHSSDWYAFSLLSAATFPDPSYSSVYALVAGAAPAPIVPYSQSLPDVPGYDDGYPSLANGLNAVEAFEGGFLMSTANSWVWWQAPYDVFRWTPEAGLVALDRINQPVPGGTPGSLLSQNRPLATAVVRRSNHVGDVALGVQESTGPPDYAPGPNLLVVCPLHDACEQRFRSGDSAPGAGGDVFQSFDPVLNDRGEVAFATTVQTPSGDRYRFAFYGPDGHGQTLLRALQGDPAFGEAYGGLEALALNDDDVALVQVGLDGDYG